MLQCVQNKGYSKMMEEIKMNVPKLVLDSFYEMFRNDRKNIFYLMYYSMIEALLLMVSPLTSAFIINSVLAHATVSIVVLGFIVIVVFLGIAVLQVIKQYMVEKFEQKIFVKNAIEVAQIASSSLYQKDNTVIDKHMNYFFDVLSIQKLFPTLMLNGSGLIVKLIVSLLLLFLFDTYLFLLGIFFVFFFLFLVLFLGKGGIVSAIQRSDAKHESIYFLQNIPSVKMEKNSIFYNLDILLGKFVKTRQKMFSIIIKQLSLTFFMEGVILSSFFILGGHLVFEGMMPIGEFVAAEIIIISVTYALRDFMKQVDYIYDMIEGFYKIDKLSKTLGHNDVSI